MTLMILKDNQDLQFGFQWILNDFVDFKRFQQILWILKTHWKNDHKTLSFTLFSIQTILFILLYFLMREREGRREERGRER